MPAGKYDRRITIRRAETVTNDFGEAIATWSDIATVWARQVPMRAAERIAAQQVVGSRVLTLQIRYRSDVSTSDRVYYNGREFNILDVREIGRRTETELDVAARDA